MKKRETSLVELLQVGNSFLIDYGPGRLGTKIIHIRAIVDGQQIVYRHWSKHKRCWRYHIEWVYQFEMLFSEGRLKRRGRSRNVTEVSNNEVRLVLVPN